MRTWRTTYWLLSALVVMALIGAACAGIAETQAGTISTQSLIFESPTPSLILEAADGGVKPDLVVVIVTPTPTGSTAGDVQEIAAVNTDASGQAAATPASTEMSEDELINMGEQVFASNCATCHQSNGEGTAEYPALNNNAFVTGQDPTPMITTILHGRGLMPAFEDNLSTQQIAAVASYVRNSWDNSASVVTVSQVRQIKGGGSASAAQPESTASAEGGNTEAGTVEESATITATGAATVTTDITATTTVTPAQESSPETEANLTPATATPMPTGAATEPPATATLATAAGVTWTPAPMVTAVESTPSPTGTTEAAQATSSPEATTGTATPAAEAGAAQPAVTATPVTDDQLISMGEEVYTGNCATCHQPNGEGTSAYPALNNNQFVTNEDPTDAIETVLHGRGEMPAFEDTLSNQQIAAALSYVRNSWDNNASAVTVAQVRQATGGGSATPPSEGESSPRAAEATATPISTATEASATQTVTATVQAGQATTIEATPTVSATAAAEESVPAGQGETSIEERTEEGGVPKQAESVVEPPEMDSMTTMDEAAEEATPISPEDLITLGSELYIISCAACHQADGQGIEGVYPNLANNAFVTSDDPTPVMEVVLTGRAGMPRFGGDLSARQIAAILSFVRNSWGNEASAVAPEQVRTLRESLTGGAGGGH